MKEEEEEDADGETSPTSFCGGGKKKVVSTITRISGHKIRACITNSISHRTWGEAKQQLN